jgi:molecular chaperone DnaK
MPIPIGIDLGTTNCCMAWIQAGRLAVFKDEHNRTTIPSLVAQTSSGEILVGWRARACRDPRYRHGFAKRALGTTQRYPLADRDVAAHTISGYVLKELKLRAEQVLGGEVAAIITVPAHFQEIHREETRRAAAEAELKVIDLLVEPIAAAVAYYQQREAGGGALADETILVFDLGGGTMDATVCVRRGTHIEVGARGRAYEGDKYLGGLDFDKALLGLAAEQLIGQGFTIETKFGVHTERQNGTPGAESRYRE